VKELSVKHWFWTLLIVMPITFYLLELFMGDAESSILSFVSYTFSSALGVLLGYALFTKGLVKISNFKAFNLLAFVIIMLLVIVLSILGSFVSINQLDVIISKVVILSFSSSAIIFAFSCKQGSNENL